MKSNLVYILLLNLLLVSCVKEVLVEKSAVVLQLSATRAGSVVVPAKADPVLPSSVSTAIYVAAKDASPINYFYQNQNFVSGTDGALLPNTGVNPITLTVGSNYDIYAYAPFNSNVTDAAAIAVSHGDDIIWTPKNSITNVSKDNCTATLAFQHCGAQISFNVVFAPDFTATSKVITANSKIEVSGFYYSGSLNLLTGKVAPAGTAAVTLSAVGTGTAGAMTLGIPLTNFIPMTTAMPLDVKVTHEGQTYGGHISTIFVNGTSNVYTITVSGLLPDLTIKGTLADWIPTTRDLNVTD